MWSSKLEFPSATSTNLTRDATATLPKCIPRSDDGTLELDLGKHVQATRVASAPLKYNASSKTQELQPKYFEDPKEKTVRVYVNQQGHTVKLARLAGPPPLFPPPSKVTQCQIGNQERNVLKNKTHQSTENSHRKEANINVGLQKRPNLIPSKEFPSIESELSTGQGSEKDLHSESATRSRNGIDLSSGRSKQMNSRSLKPKLGEWPEKTLPNLVDNSESKNIVGMEYISKNLQNECHTSAMRDQLDSGLKKIMADLAALDLPNLSDKSISAIISENDDKQVHNSIQLKNEHSKENDLPCRDDCPREPSDSGSAKGRKVARKPPSSPRSLKRPSNEAPNVLKGSNHDLRKNSNSSLNSSNKNPCDPESSNSKGCTSREKQRSYDPERAREYIRLQKQERMNRIKEERERQQADMQARKQKLDELSRTSLKLVKASVKRKSGPANSSTINDEVIDCENNHINGTFKKSSDSSYNLNNPDILPKSFHDAASSFPHQYSISDVPLPLDDSNAQLIKDICEMKSKIEAMARSLKTTIDANRGNFPRSSTNTESKTTLHSSSELSCKPLTMKANDMLTDNKQDLSVPDVLLDPKVHPPYLCNLTTNLRKMRESLLSVLSQKETVSCESAEKSKTPMQNLRQPRHRRFSSAGSDSAFETLKLDHNGRAPSLDGHLSTGLHKKKITTSFPTLPLAGSQDIVFDRKQYSSDDAEKGESKPSSSLNNAFVHSTPATGSTRSVESQLQKSEETIIRGTSEKKYPDWVDNFASEPYPVNIMSAVKRKLCGSIKSDPLSERMTVRNDANNSVPANGTSRYPPLDLKSDLPPFVTTRRAPELTPSVATWSTINPDPSPSMQTSSSPMPDVEVFEREMISEKLNESSLVLKTSILDALNLERMQAEFVKALNPIGAHSSDITPAEKPLSAPNTPAKIPLKLMRPTSSGKTGKLMFEDKSQVNNEVTLSTLCDEDNNQTNAIDKDHCAASAFDNNELVPPNVTLASGRLDRKPGSVDSWVSHSRGSQERCTSVNPTDEISSSTQVSSASRDTFEIGHVFNPTALHLQFQAELNILDSFNESLCQVMEVEKVHAISLAKQKILSELEEAKVPTEDKAIDVQTSLLTPNSDNSFVNYKRGSADPNDVSILDDRTAEAAASSDCKSNNSSDRVTDGVVKVKEKASVSLLPYASEACHLSPSVKIVTESSKSCIDKKSSETISTPITSVDDEILISSTQSPKSAEKSTSEDMNKSVSEDINTMSDSIPEEKPEDASAGSLISWEDKLDHESSSENVEPFNSSNNHVENGGTKVTDVSFYSSKNDSTFTGEDALIIDSLQTSHHRVFPTLGLGEDMFQFSLQMLEQLMHEEELRVQHKNTLLKLRVKVLGEMARAEVAALDLDKKKLREKGEDGHKDQITALRKKQRGIMLRFQQQQEEIERIRRTEELAWQERRLMYLQQMHLVRMQISTHVMLHKFEKEGCNVSKKGRIFVKSIQDSRNPKVTVKSLAPELGNVRGEISSGLAVTQSSSVSMASLGSEGSKSSAVSNSSRRAPAALASSSNCAVSAAGAGDSESSYLEERVLKGLNELESRCRNLKDREKILHERKQSVEQIIQWRRKLEEEERCLRDVEKQAHARHRSALSKHMLRDRSTSPFQFLENNGCGNTSTANGTTGSRSISELARSGRSNICPSVSGSASVTEDIDSSIPEDLGEQTSKPSGESTLDGTNVDQYANESFESELSEVKTLDSQTILQDGSQVSSQKEQIIQQPRKIDLENESRVPRMSERSNKYPGVTIKVPLSPRLQRVQRRRYSSGSDDSMVLSQTETGSEQSDIEGRISALSEQLHQCKAEAERLRREAKRTRNERLIAKEQSLHKQLQAYETYISQLRRNLEAELKQSSVPIVRPQIKQPRVASGKVASRRQDTDVISTPATESSVAPVASSVAGNAGLSKDEIEADFKEAEVISEAVSTVVSEAASEVASETGSEVPSDVASEAASEVSENSSLVSQDAQSLVANRVFNQDPYDHKDSPSRQEERTVEVSSREMEISSDIIVVKTEEEGSMLVEFPEKRNAEDSLAIRDLAPEDTGGIKTEVESNSNKIPQYFKKYQDAAEYDSQDEPLSNKKDDITASIDQVKSISSEEELDDISEVPEDEESLVVDNSIGSNIIRVFVKEKEKESQSISQSASQSISEIAICKSSVLTDQKDSGKAQLVDDITDKIFKGLVSECLRSVAYTHTPSQNKVFDEVVNLSLHEATLDLISIYRRKVQVTRTPSKDVRRRVNEILAETHSSSKLRSEGRIKEMMTTAYGVLSPQDSPCVSPNFSSSPVQQHPSGSVTNEDSDTTYNEMAESSAQKSSVGKASDAPMGLMGDNVLDSEGFSQEWFDEDFGLTKSKREAEELRRQQLQIEQEIEQLQQQQAQVQEQIPYYYVREIPNKPPPPYTPPGQAPRVLSSSTSLTASVDEVRAVCTDRPVILKAIADAVDMLYDARNEGRDLECQEAPSSYLDVGFGLPEPSHLSDQELEIHKNNARVYRIFLFDLAKELVLNAYSSESEDPSPPWLRPEHLVRRRKALTVVPKSREMLHDVVERQVLVLFGFIPKASKENLTIRWSRKKRDHVDELLVRESQEEERQWTNYEQDEAVVKNNVAIAILDSLLDDTIQVLSDVFRRRDQRQRCPLYEL